MAVLLNATTGCDDGFSPIEPGEVEFSIFGALDASADTQWIRIMPLRPLVLTSPEPGGIRATLEKLGSGRVIEMRDSVFRFDQHNPEFGSESVYALNFWTTERIEPGAAYRFQAVRDGSDAAEAIVQIPPDYEVEVGVRQWGNFEIDELRIEGLRHLALVTAIRLHEGGCVEQRLFPFERAESDHHTILLYRIDWQQLCTGRLVKQECLVVGSGAEWPTGLDTNAFRLGVREAPSNVSRSIGFLGGVLTKPFTYRHCPAGEGDLAPTDELDAAAD